MGVRQAPLVALLYLRERNPVDRRDSETWQAKVVLLAPCSGSGVKEVPLQSGPTHTQRNGAEVMPAYST